MGVRFPAAVLLLAGIATPCIGEGPNSLRAVLGVTSGGEATNQWLAMIRKRLPAAQYELLATARRPLTDAEERWADMIRSRVTSWETRREGLASPFLPLRPPGHVLIVMGNQGGDDAFTHDATTIGFDLSALQSAYGDASLADNPERIDRLFDHEYTHLLQKAWLADHPYPADSPQRGALLDIWLEGLGHYRSLSGRWRADDGQASPAAREALAALGPRFAARLSALACASAEEGRALTEDLARGPFRDKWGALPAALWLEAEASRDQAALRRFVLAGPDEVWSLAARHLPDALRAVLDEARAAATICSMD